MYLMHRISHENSASVKLLKEDNLLPIGWSILKGEKAERVLRNAKEMEQHEFRDDFVELGNEINNNWLTARRSNYLYRFLKLDKGDRVLIPKSGELDLCEVTGSPYAYDNPEGIDIGFVVPVRMISMGISRHRYVPADLASKLKYRGTNLRLNDKDIDTIEKMVINYRDEVPFYDFTPTRDSIVKKIHDYLTQLNDQHFEELIKAYMVSIGADVTVIPPKNSNSQKNSSIADVDVKAAFTTLDIVIYVQAKRHTGKSDDTGIRQLLAYKYEEDDRFEHLEPFKWFITTGEFDKNTADIPQDEQGERIRVIQDTEFASMLVDSGFVFKDDIFKRG
ncbi:restriction endonuclease [Salinicoccus roseus]|uniref:restriction endonuclease n=1 Tax=Salinicoccus roseus TaxID=45670 RepID=UPI00230006DD|nr:restriction endonuclease [Salinicoccus roseus]